MEAANQNKETERNKKMNTTQNVIIKTEKLKSVRDRQVIWAGWMKLATHGMADDSFVQTQTQITPFGNFLIAIEIA